MATTDLKKALPHLPTRTHHYDHSSVPGKSLDVKAMPQSDWRTDLNQLQVVVPMPMQQSGQVSRRERDDRSSQHGIVVPHAVAWYDKQCDAEVPEGYEAPPVFSSQPKRMATITTRPSRTQKDIYRMDNGIEPTQLLCDRLEVWRFAIKDLVKFFKCICQVETDMSKGYIRGSKLIQVPFRDSHGQFLASGGIEDVWSSISQYAREHSMLNREYVHYIERAVLPSLRNIKADIKQTTKSVRHDSNFNTSDLFKQRIQVDRLVNKLDSSIKSAQQDPINADQQADPALVNLGVIHAIKHLFVVENTMHENVVHLQREMSVFEQKIIHQIQSVLEQLHNYLAQYKMDYPGHIGKVIGQVQSMQPDMEWNEFVRRNQSRLVPENAVYKTEGAIRYPNQDHALVQPIKMGPLQRRTGLTRQFVQGLYVLTPAGFLHGYKSQADFETHPQQPQWSTFLPHAVVYQSNQTDRPYVLDIRLSQRHFSPLGKEKSTLIAANNGSDYQSWIEAIMGLTQRFQPPAIDFTERQFQALPAPPAASSPLPGSSSMGLVTATEGSAGGAEAGLRRQESKSETPINASQEEGTEGTKAMADLSDRPSELPATTSTGYESLLASNVSQSAAEVTPDTGDAPSALDLAPMTAPSSP